jgi:hypothetical protein
MTWTKCGLQVEENGAVLNQNSAWHALVHTTLCAFCTKSFQVTDATASKVTTALANAPNIVCTTTLSPLLDIISSIITSSGWTDKTVASRHC